MYVLNKYGYIENYATGLKKATEAYLGYVQRPIYESTEHFFVVTLPNVNYTDGKVNDEVKLKPNTQNVLKAIKATPFVTREKIAEQYKISRAIVDRCLKELKDNGFIGEKEIAKTGSWKILKQYT